MTGQPQPSPKAHRSDTEAASQAAAAAAFQQRAREAVTIRNEIAARLMRLHCDRAGGCTRSCRRQKRCVVADAVDREARGEQPVASPRPSRAASPRPSRGQG